LKRPRIALACRSSRSSLQLKLEERLFGRYIAWIGLGACLFLAFWVDIEIWLIGLGIIGLGLIWHEAARHFLRRTTSFPAGRD
jgi:hypothetical protein